MNTSPKTSVSISFFVQCPELMFSFLKSSICSSFSGSCLPDGLYSKKTSPPLYTPFAKHKPLCYKGGFAKITSRNRWQQTRAVHQHLGSLTSHGPGLLSSHPSCPRLSRCFVQPSESRGHTALPGLFPSVSRGSL